MEDDSKNFNIVTAYNSLKISQRQGCFELRSGDAALQSVVDLDHPQQLQLRNLEQLMGILLFIDEPRSILVLGTAAGSLLHFLRHHYPQADICSVDIDVELVGDVSARIEIDTFNGDIRNCFGPDPERTSKYTPGWELSFTEGDGDGRIEMSTLNGDLSLCSK